MPSFLAIGLASGAADGFERGAQEIHVVDARNLDRVLERQEHALARPFVGRERQEIAAEIRDAALGDLVAGPPGEDAGER